MQKYQYLTIIAIAALFVLSSCSSAPPSPTGDHFGPRGGFGRGNMTDEQRQQMMDQMRQSGIDACQGKSNGEDCMMENPRGQINGTCSTSDDGSVQCRGQRPNGNWSGQRPPRPQ